MAALAPMPYGKREDNGCSKTRTALEQPRPVPDVLRQGLPEMKGARLCELLPDRQGIPERPEGCLPCFLRRHPAIEVLPDLHFKMCVQLFAVVAIPSAEPLHGCSSSGRACKTPLTARTSCSHLPVSATNFFRPARVSL